MGEAVRIIHPMVAAMAMGTSQEPVPWKTNSLALSGANGSTKQQAADTTTIRMNLSAVCIVDCPRGMNRDRWKRLYAV